jgi:hypothetical protein
MLKVQSNYDSKSNQKRKFTRQEDYNIIEIIDSNGNKDWELISTLMTNRNPRQCKERWENYLNPIINQSPWTKEEDEKLINLRNEIGSHWVSISCAFKGRVDIALKNRWKYLEK